MSRAKNMTADEQMLMIHALDPGASLKISSYTRAWYIEADIGIGDGSMVRGVTEHCETPDRAILAFFERLTEVTDNSRHIIAKPYGERRHYRWNGAAFAELPMERSS